MAQAGTTPALPPRARALFLITRYGSLDSGAMTRTGSSFASQRLPPRWCEGLKVTQGPDHRVRHRTAATSGTGAGGAWLERLAHALAGELRIPDARRSSAPTPRRPGGRGEARCRGHPTSGCSRRTSRSNACWRCRDRRRPGLRCSGHVSSGGSVRGPIVRAPQSGEGVLGFAWQLQEPLTCRVGQGDRADDSVLWGA